MKKYILLLIAAMFLVACGSNEEVETQEKAEDIEQELEKEGKPKILALVLGNENIKVDNLECANISEVTKRISEYENAYLRKNPGNILEIISSDISNFIKYFGNLMSFRNILETS